MKQEIHSVSEAFSMQPMVQTVISDVTRGQYQKPGDCLMKIELKHQVLDGESISFYVGESYNGDILFRYRANACNVTYFPLTR